MGRNDYSSLLYSQPSTLEGFARVLDSGGMFDSYNESSSTAEADRLAMASDWYAVSADLLRAIKAYQAKLRAGKSGQADDL
jgi:hypothetical protein